MAVPTLRRFEIIVRYTASSAVAAGARVLFYRQGATLNRTSDLVLNPGDNATLDVYYTGRILSSDWLAVDGNINNSLLITSVNTAGNQIGVTCGAVSLTIHPFSRLTPIVATTRGPTAVICNDPMGSVVATQPLIVD